MLASCCILSYNRPQFLAMAVESLVAGAGSELVEIIVHDDGSTDTNVGPLLDSMLASGKVSTVIKNSPGHNQGQGVALNRMFGMAKGDVILKLDQDLIFHGGWLPKTLALVEDNPEIGLLGLFHYHHDPVDSKQCIIDQFDGWQSHTHICGSGFAMPREAWEDLGPFEEYSEAFAEDWVMQMRVTDSDRYVCALPDEDLVSNQGFGMGPSTVVIPDIHGQPSVERIHKTPFLIGGKK